MTTILVMILVLIVISLALSVMTLAALGDLISRLVADSVKREYARASGLRAAIESAEERKLRVPHYDA